MSERTPQLLIEDIIQSSRKIMTYTEGMSYVDFLSDEKTIDAVVRNFEIIGEAANRLPGGFKHQHTSIDWKRIRGFRNRIVHDYFGIDFEIVWKIKSEYLPGLILHLSELLKS